MISVFQESLLLDDADIGGAGPPVHLPFIMQHQEQDQWCWAAVSVSVAAYYGDAAWTQCEVVNLELAGVDCCGNGAATDGCNKPWSLEKALRRVTHLRAAVPSRVDLADVRRDVDARFVVGVRIGWGHGGGHFVVIAGYGAGKMIDVEDPWYGPGTYDGDAFAVGYQGDGSWTHTYWTT